MQQATVIAANRFGLGARPGDLERIDPDPRAWLLDQLGGPSRPPEDLADLPRAAQVLADVRSLRRAQRRDARPTDTDTDAAPDAMRTYGRTVRAHYVEQTQARYRTAAASEHPFHERLVHFWSNHFAVSVDKQPLAAIAGLYENEAIRPHVAGRFADLLLAAVQHPAMILYLDNQRSIGPSSSLARRASQRRGNLNLGLNENLAREILELHTLGVDGGYTQDDVTAFAKVITGWSIGGSDDGGRFADGEPGEFEFRGPLHEPGDQCVLGRRYRRSGVDQGLAVLRDLAVHPSTARFIATKLARHFVADVPPAGLVERLASTFLETDGDLAAVYEALVTAPEPWTQMHAKYKTPNDFVLSAFRAFDRVPDDARFVVAALDLMGQTPFRPGSPEGWPDTAEQWGGADALYKRIEWCGTVARVVGARARPIAVGEAALGPALSDSTRRAVVEAESTAQGTTLLLASPDFQRR